MDDVSPFSTICIYNGDLITRQNSIFDRQTSICSFLGHIVTHHDKATKHVFLGHQFCDSILLEIPKLNLNYLLKPNEKIWSQKHAFVIQERFFVLKAQ